MEKITHTRVQQVPPHRPRAGASALPSGGRRNLHGAYAGRGVRPVHGVHGAEGAHGVQVQGGMKAGLALGGTAAALWFVSMCYTLTSWTLGG
ncbi:hypothetical protein [Streptomyces zingiberis]|uniref:Uncharacterized protein n=1 Tax=Streptomyces zingiberis TaxID=2053010 RepID=A0ABX1C5T1_9ACTN|nr:hypothetical protein [Streptomyces zingiberis]NJQ03943.1 hypothetical protein [Streptomyces zingiberis]